MGGTAGFACLASGFAHGGLVVADVENLGVHYARTLKQWHARFERHADEVADMFDEEFVRTWRLYLCGSAAAFTAARLQLFQVLFKRRACRHLAETRAGLYVPGLLRTSELNGD